MRRHIIKLENDDVIRVDDLTIHNIEIVADSDYPDKVELYVVDSDGNRLEGGTFDIVGFHFTLARPSNHFFDFSRN